MDALLESSVPTASVKQSAQQSAQQSVIKSKTETVATKEQAELNANSIRIHFYLGPVVRTEIVNRFVAGTAKEENE